MSKRKVDWRWKQKVHRERKKLERKPELAVCWLCGEAIDMNLSPEHRAAFTLDHVVPLARGGDLHGEVRPAHRFCNSSRGQGRGSSDSVTLVGW